MLKDRCIINRGAHVQSKIGDIIIGVDVTVGAHSKIVAQSPIEIGDNVSIAGNVFVVSGRFVVERSERLEDDKRRFSSRAIRIEKNCRIGINSIIQDGVHIGEGAIGREAAEVSAGIDVSLVVF